MARPRSGWSELLDTAMAVAVAVVLALLIRHFVVETYRVDGQSMEPTLQNGERLLVNKFIYRFRLPRDGQVIIFQPPIDERTDFVKRVVGTAGQTVAMTDGVIYLNGVAQAEPYLPRAWRDQYTMPARTVPAGDVFVLGDHRGASMDSRYFGYVPVAAIRGLAEVVWWPPADARSVRRASVQ